MNRPAYPRYGDHNAVNRLLLEGKSLPEIAQYIEEHPRTVIEVDEEGEDTSR